MFFGYSVSILAHKPVHGHRDRFLSGRYGPLRCVVSRLVSVRGFLWVAAGQRHSACVGSAKVAVRLESAELVSVADDLRGSPRGACLSASAAAPCPARGRCPLVTLPAPTPTPCPAPLAPLDANDGLLRHARHAAWPCGACLSGVLCGCRRGGSCGWRWLGISTGSSGGADPAPPISQRVTLVGTESRVDGVFSAGASRTALPDITEGFTWGPGKRRGEATPSILGDRAVRGAILLRRLA